jgi:hypothetical protein
VAGAGAGGAVTVPGLDLDWSGVLDSFGVEGTDLAVASSSPTTLDLFTVSSEGVVSLHRFVDTWLPAQDLSAPVGVTFTAVAAASLYGQLDVIATGPDHKLYSNYAPPADDTPSFTGWAEIGGAVTSGKPNSLAVVALGNDSFHTFWLTDMGNVGHGWGSHFWSWDAIESGDDDGIFYLQPVLKAENLGAVSMAGSTYGRIDIVLDGSESLGLQHLWYDADNGGWGMAAAPQREQLPCRKLELNAVPFAGKLSGFAVISPEPGMFDVFVSEHAESAPTAVYHTSFWANQGWSGPGAQIWFDRVALDLHAPSTVVDGIVWAGAEQRRDLFGVFGDGSDSVWQAYYH